MLPPLKKYYTPNGDQDDLISIGTIGLIKGVSTFKPDKNVRLATYASRCIENEILMYFRSQRKLQGELSLSDSLDGEGENGSLSLIDVVRVDDNMLEELDLRDACAKVRRFTRDERKAGESPGAFRAPGQVLLPAVRAVAGTGADAFLTGEQSD